MGCLHALVRRHLVVAKVRRGIHRVDAIGRPALLFAVDEFESPLLWEIVTERFWHSTSDNGQSLRRRVRLVAHQIARARCPRSSHIRAAQGCEGGPLYRLVNFDVQYTIRSKNNRGLERQAAQFSRWKPAKHNGLTSAGLPGTFYLRRRRTSKSVKLPNSSMATNRTFLHGAYSLLALQRSMPAVDGSLARNPGEIPIRMSPSAFVHARSSIMHEVDHGRGHSQRSIPLHDERRTRLLHN